MSASLMDRPTLRVLGTRETLLESIRQRAEEELGFRIEYDVLDGIDAVTKAVTEPGSYDVCDHWHPIELAWTARSVQAIDIERIDLWDEISPLTKTGMLNGRGRIGQGAAPVRSLYVQHNGNLGGTQTDRVSMLPTVHNVDSFGYDPVIAEDIGADEEESWSWLLDDRWHGRVALLLDPAIGWIDAALATQACGLATFEDIGNMTLPEIDTLVEVLKQRKKAGHFGGFWNTWPESVQLMKHRGVVIESIWSPAVMALRASGRKIVNAAPREGYRGWHSGMSVSARTVGRQLDLAYEYLNWWMSGWAGAVMARQGYYMAAIEPVRRHLSAAEWDYWYDGQPARCDLADPGGQIIVQSGEHRDGGGYWQRMSNVAVWNSFMDEQNYLVRRWNEFLRA